jgi:dinuclear metal center YbgI/SA1388 family protein
MTAPSLRIADLARVMNEVAPLGAAEEWDNVGLLVGDASGSLSHLLLAIDMTREVVAEAQRKGCEAIVSYHPPIFGGLKRLVAPSPSYEAARAGLAVYSPHTALDAAKGGTNDILADVLGMKDRTPLRVAGAGAAERKLKLVTFVPAENVAAVSQAVFAAGAGHIGNYSSCSFRAPGTGTFLGEEGANPVVGKAGRLEDAPELRLETIVPESVLPDVVRALRASHPYEEPAFDLVPLAAEPRGVGQGRVGTVDAVSVGTVADRLKAALGVQHVMVVGALDRRVERVGLCVGSGGELLSDAIAAKADLFVTGELRHHDALRAQAAGIVVICTLHSTSERIALNALEKALATRLAGVTVSRSEADREPFAFF